MKHVLLLGIKNNKYKVMHMQQKNQKCTYRLMSSELYCPIRRGILVDSLMKVLTQCVEMVKKANSMLVSIREGFECQMG